MPNEGAMVVPGFDLDHDNYYSLEFIKTPKSTPLEKLAERIDLHHKELSLRKRLPEACKKPQPATKIAIELLELVEKCSD